MTALIKIVLILLLLVSPVWAQTNHAVRAPADCANNGDGTTWACAASPGAAGAFDGLPATLTRGDTYYLGDGTYPGYKFDDAVDGTTYIYIKKATATAHGPAGSWDNTYGDGTITFTCNMVFSGTSVTGLWLQKNYISIDGVVGGGPNAWTSGHGIVVELPESASTSRGMVLGDPSAAAGYTGARISHVEIKGPASCFPRPVIGYGGGISAASGGGAYGNSDIEISYCYIHNIGGQHISMRALYQDNVTVEYSFLDKVASGYSLEGNHGILMRNDCAADYTIRYNMFGNAVGTGFLGFYNGSTSPCYANHDNQNIKIYGNIFFCDPSYGYCGGKVITFQTGGGYPNAFGTRIYNNTFYSIYSMGTYGLDDSHANDVQELINIESPDSDNLAKNNLVWDILTHEASVRTFVGLSSFDYNAGDYATTTPADSHWQYLVSSPFVSVDHTNSSFLKPSANTTAGVDLGATYNTDMLGNTRTTWTRGAFEYAGAPEPDTTPPVRSALAPSGELTCTSDPRNVTISLTTDEAATCKYGADVAYASMAGTFDGTGTTSHSKTISQACDAAYQFFVRCQDDEASPNVNPASAEINYTIDPIAADTTKPTWTSSTLAADGRTLTLVFNEAVKRGASYADTQVTVTPTGGAATLSYVSGDGSTTLVYYTSRVINSTATETLTTSIAQPGNGIEDQALNDLDAVATKATTNNSTQIPVVPATAGQKRLWADDVTVGDDVTSEGYAGEFGVKFGSTVAGVISAIRFYKSAANTGTHVGNIWFSTGGNKGTVTFADETASGWQQQAFTSLVHVAANTTYVASYFNPAGAWTRTVGYFGAANFTNSPLYTLANTEGNGYNGCTTASPYSSFPNVGSAGGRNYWVDVVFEQRSTLTIH